MQEQEKISSEEAQNFKMPEDAGSLDVAEKESSLDSLSPESIEDVEGQQREMYTFSDAKGRPVKALFYQKEDLPFTEAMTEERQGFILGNEPSIRSKEEWKQFTENIRSHSAKDISPTGPLPAHMAETLAEGHASFFVERNPKSLLEFAFYLGADSKELRQFYEDIRKNNVTPEVEQMLDTIIAGNIIDDEGYIKTDYSTKGEALYIKMLQGDTAAANELAEKLEALRAHDTELKQADMNEMREFAGKRKDVEPLKLDDLVAVHATGYLPKKQSGQLGIQTTSDAGGAPRNSIHFALNHHVAGHMYGNWNAAPYVMISPLDKLIEQNKKPASLNTVDTYFEMSPGQNLKLPPEETKIIRPGKIEPGELFRAERDGSIRYQSGALESADIGALRRKASRDEIYSIEHDMRATLENAVRHNLEFDDPDFNKNYDERYQEAYKLTQKLHEYEMKPGSMLDAIEEKGMDSFLSELIADAGIDGHFADAQKKVLSDSVEGTIRSGIKEIAVRTTIENMGYEAHRGGMWAWDGDDWDTTAATAKLASNMGVNTGPHSTTEEAQAIQAYYDAAENLKEGEYSHAEYKQMIAKDNERFADKISPELRRVLYTRGLL